MIRIRYFASLRETLDIADETLALPPEAVTVAGLAAWLRHRGGIWAAAFDPARPMMAAVNQEFAQPRTPLADGDEVAFFPPVTGG